MKHKIIMWEIRSRGLTLLGDFERKYYYDQMVIKNWKPIANRPRERPKTGWLENMREKFVRKKRL